MKVEVRPPVSAVAGPGPVSNARPWSQELRPGDLLDDRFLITDVISRGGMAVIFKAEDRQNQNAPVVLKVPFKSVELNTEYFGRFLREEEIGGRLNHPCILKFIPVTGYKSRPYIVIEYLVGRTLYDLMNELRIFPERDALEITGLVCEGLEYLHQQGIVHRDLKPENIMICCDGSIRIMDFGISCAADSRRLTYVGFAPGTPHYMAPERVNRKRGDARTDIYSLGAMLYEMLTGKIAFDHENLLVIMNARVTGDPEAPRRLNPKLTPQAEEIVLRAMDRDPAQRYPSAAAFKADLDAPDRVQVTGRCHRLESSTALRRGWRNAQKIILWCLVPVLAQIVTFFLLWHHYTKK